MTDALPHWLEPLPGPAAARATDAWAIEERGISGLALMERASAGLAAVVQATAPEGRIAVVAGKGHNGGDGVAAARLLHAGGRDVVVLDAWSPAELRSDALRQLELWPGPAPLPFHPSQLAGAAVVVDALLGTGATGAPREAFAACIEAMNACGAPIVACDVPSGVDAATGEVAGAAVHAVATATFHAAKPGLWITPGKDRAGAVTVVDIGIPPGREPVATEGLIRDTALAGLPGRAAGSTKFSSGAVVVVGGSRGLTGAPCLAAWAAVRAGAGYVTVAGARSLEAAFTARPLESMLAVLPDDGDGGLGPDALEPALAALGRADAAVVGPGFGRDPAAQALARELVTRAELPLVVDADGLNALAATGFEAVVAGRTAPTVLTPHAGELSRLLGIDSGAIARTRLEHARAAARRSGAVVVLKGDDTLVAAPDGRVAVSPGGAPALATAGTGDVLSGVVAALLARGLEPFHAAAAGVLAHVRAGRIASTPHGPDAVIASDVIAALPEALDHLASAA